MQLSTDTTMYSTIKINDVSQTHVYVNMSCDNNSYCLCTSLPYSATNRPVWIKNVECDEADLHLLRCTHDIASGTERNTCGSSEARLLVQCGKATNKNRMYTLLSYVIQVLTYQEEID